MEPLIEKPPFAAIPVDAVIISRHHEWAGGGARDGNTVVCVDCGIRVEIGRWPSKKCARKAEHPHSGYSGAVFEYDGLRRGRIIGRFNRVGHGPVRYKAIAGTLQQEGERHGE